MILKCQRDLAKTTPRKKLWHAPHSQIAIIVRVRPPTQVSEAVLSLDQASSLPSLSGDTPNSIRQDINH